MAVLKEIPRLEVTVEVDDETAIEHANITSGGQPSLTHDDFHLADPNLPLPYAVKYIEAKPGAPFQFQIERTRKFKFKGPHVFFKVVVDGQSDNSSIGDNKKNSKKAWSRVYDRLISRTKGGRTDHHFKFGNLNVGDVDNPTCADLEKHVKETKEWGTLLVKCFHGAKSYITPTRARPLVQVDTSTSSAKSVSERAVKGKSVDALTELDTKSVRQSARVTIYPFLDSRRRPFAIFEFRYRTRNGLMEEGVLPRPPTPTPEETVRDMSETEVRRLAQDLLAAERERAKATAIKEENARGIKRELEPTNETDFRAKYKSRRTDSGRFEVDLTGDD